MKLNKKNKFYKNLTPKDILILSDNKIGRVRISYEKETIQYPSRINIEFDYPSSTYISGKTREVAGYSPLGYITLDSNLNILDYRRINHLPDLDSILPKRRLVKRNFWKDDLWEDIPQERYDFKPMIDYIEEEKRIDDVRCDNDRKNNELKKKAILDKIGITQVELDLLIKQH